MVKKSFNNRKKPKHSVVVQLKLYSAKGIKLNINKWNKTQSTIHQNNGSRILFFLQWLTPNTRISFKSKYSWVTLLIKLRYFIFPSSYGVQPRCAHSVLYIGVNPVSAWGIMIYRDKTKASWIQSLWPSVLSSLTIN